MGYKSRPHYAQGQNVSEDRWQEIFKGEPNEFEIGCDQRVSSTSIDVPNQSGECSQTESNGESNC